MRFERRDGGSGFGGRRFGGGGGRRFGGGFGGGRSRSFSDEPKPVKVGDEYDVEISETGSRGDGIARVNNFVVFVNGAKQGEKLKIKITDVRDRFAIGQKAGAEDAASDAPIEQSVEGTDDMSEASDATESTVKEDLGDEDEGSGDEDTPDDKGSDDDEEQ